MRARDWVQCSVRVGSKPGVESARAEQAFVPGPGHGVSADADPCEEVESLRASAGHKDAVTRAHREVELALRVAYALEHGLSQAEIAARLGVAPGDVKAAAAQLKRVRARLEQGD
jgi:DNA-directed RNA polymerase specialized sigma24 family protein